MHIIAIDIEYLYSAAVSLGNNVTLIYCVQPVLSNHEVMWYIVFIVLIFPTACKYLSSHRCMCLLALCFSYQHGLGTAGQKPMIDAESQHPSSESDFCSLSVPTFIYYLRALGGAPGRVGGGATRR